MEVAECCCEDVVPVGQPSQRLLAPLVRRGQEEPKNKPAWRERSRSEGGKLLRGSWFGAAPMIIALLSLFPTNSTFPSTRAGILLFFFCSFTSVGALSMATNRVRGEEREDWQKGDKMMCCYLPSFFCTKQPPSPTKPLFSSGACCLLHPIHCTAAHSIQRCPCLHLQSERGALQKAVTLACIFCGQQSANI